MRRGASLIVAGVAGLLLSSASLAQSNAPASQPQGANRAAGTRPSTGLPNSRARGGRPGATTGTNAAPSQERRLEGLIKEVGLTPDQQMRARVILQQYGQEAGQTRDLGRQHEVMQAAWDKIENTVLTNAQQEKVAASRITRQKLDGLAALKLTPDQQKQVQTILNERRTDASKADTVAGKREAWQKALERIGNEVLTADQRKAWKETRGKR